jgi:glycosidase
VYDPISTRPNGSNGIIYQILRSLPNGVKHGPNGSELLRQPAVFHETWNEKMLDWRVDKLPNGDGYWNSDFYGGDLAGITEKLDYLQALGVTGIYLNPIFAARSNHRYDTADYKQIDPMLGTLDDFRRLVGEADRRGIKVILDGAFNHLSRTA